MLPSCEQVILAVESSCHNFLIRVLPYLGIVMSQEGGALAEMLLPSKLGVGGPLGGGAQVCGRFATVACERGPSDTPV